MIFCQYIEIKLKLHAVQPFSCNKNNILFFSYINSICANTDRGNDDDDGDDEGI